MISQFARLFSSLTLDAYSSRFQGMYRYQTGLHEFAEPTRGITLSGYQSFFFKKIRVSIDLTRLPTTGIDDFGDSIISRLISLVGTTPS